jgi:tRNA G18 (ribose-2'-O)-methylase SpoU
MMHSVAKMILTAALIMSSFSCTTIPEPDDQYLDQQAQQLVETDERMVQNCINLGSVSRSADMTKFLGIHLTKRNIQLVKRQAAQLGATHIIWLYQYKNSAAALAYSCR